MSRERRISCLIAAVLAFCVSFGGIACIITGFSLNLEDGSVSPYYYSVPADLETVLVFCALLSAVAAVAFSFRRGGWILLGLLALLLGYLWRLEILEVSLEAVLYRITYAYNQAYRCGLVKWTDAFSPEISPNLGFCIMAGIPVLATAWTVCCRKSAVPAVLCCCVMLGVCVVVTDTVPAVWCLFLLLSGMVLLMLTNTVRRRSLLDGNRLTALLLVPALLFVSLLFWAVPSEGYEATTESIQQVIAEWFQSHSFGQSSGSGASGTSDGAVDLTTVGPKTELYYAVMNVTAAEDGMLYLRGQALDDYDGKYWDISKTSSGVDSGWPSKNMSMVGTVTISTRSGHAVKYFPYYPSGGHWPANKSLSEGGLANPYRQREYSFSQMKIAGSTGAQLSQKQREQCIALPQNTKVRAVDFLKKLGDLTGKSTREVAAAIGKFVSESARYDLNTSRMPSYESDFAIWFLQEADSGYCIHFATAATVLLRAKGIPARYVSGYVVKAQANETVTVTANRAHAWVEYFVPNEGWVVLDPTPGSWYGETEDTTSPPDTTEPEATTRPSEGPDVEPTETEPEPTEPSVDVTHPNGGGNDSGDQPKKLDLSWLWPVLRWIGLFLGICIAVAGQYYLRLRLRHRRMHTGHPNQRTLARWRAVLRMSRILKEEPPEVLYELAEKARFSQHTITVAERMEFDQYLNHADQQLHQKRWFKRWMIRLFWAV